MRTVEDRSGDRYLLLKRSRESSLVRDPVTGEQRFVPTDELVAIEGVSPLETAAAGLPSAARRFVTAVHDERALGLLVALDAADGLSTRALLEADEFCESDLNGLLVELRAAQVIDPAEIDGEEGYRLTADAAAILHSLQSASAVC